MNGPDDHARIAPLVPWLANGTLGADETAEVERHVESCAACRELLATVRDPVELTERLEAEQLAHVHPVLLTEYAEDPESLDHETVEWIESRLDRCEICREAHRRLVEVQQALRPAAESVPAVREAGSGLRVLWERLAASLLRPAPALGYLMLLLLLAPALLLSLRSGDEAGPAVALPRIVDTSGDRTTRDTGAAPARPLELSGEAVLLRLRTDLRPVDLERLGFELELARGETPLWTRAVERADFVTDDGRVTLAVALRPDRFEPGAEHELRLRVSAPADALDGNVLFRKRFTVSP